MPPFFLKKKFFAFLSSSILALHSFSAQAEPPLQPPTQNPHPPQSEADKMRVAFAEQAVDLLLKRELPKETLDQQKKMMGKPFTPGLFRNKDLDCLKSPTCYGADTTLIIQLASLHQYYGRITESRHAHIIPWSWEKFRPSQKTVSESARNPEMGPRESENAHKPTMDAPQLKPDEYMVHMYVKFSKDPGAWYHLDVILTEDAEGRPALRHFFIAPMSPALPPGVVC